MSKTSRQNKWKRRLDASMAAWQQNQGKSKKGLSPSTKPGSKQIKG